MAVWRRLRQLGSVSPAGSLHLLPESDEAREAFAWLAQEIRAMAPDVKLLAVTGWLSREVSGEFDAMLEKPVEPEVLCATLAALLQP